MYLANGDYQFAHDPCDACKLVDQLLACGADILATNKEVCSFACHGQPEYSSNNSDAANAK